jgi:hypothetical protein
MSQKNLISVSIIGLSSFLSIMPPQQAVATNPTIPTFNESSHDTGELLRHSYKLCTDIEDKINKYRQSGRQHVGLENGLVKLENLTKGKVYIDIDSYQDFLNQNSSLFNANDINISTVPTSIIEETTQCKFGIFILPVTPNDYLRYVQNIQGQLKVIREEQLGRKMDLLNVQRLAEEAKTLLKNQRFNIILENFFKKNHSILQNVGVKDPRDFGFKRS